MSAQMSSSLLGAVSWILALQFFAVQVIVALAFTPSFSVATNVISDLGNTVCGPYPPGSANVVCSPWHAAMNASFAVLGVTMSAGALLTAPCFRPGWRRTLAIVLFLGGGIGVILVGLFPENERALPHAAGATANFLGANAALILFGASLPSRPGFSAFSRLAGSIGLAAALLFASEVDLGLGAGGIERFAAYPVPVWQIVAGLVLLRSPVSARQPDGRR